MTNKKLTDMSLEELDARRQELMKERDDILAELHAVTKEYHWLEQQASAQELVENMTDSQRLAVESVLANSKVGTPGV